MKPSESSAKATLWSQLSGLITSLRSTSEDEKSKVLDILKSAVAQLEKKQSVSLPDGGSDNADLSSNAMSDCNNSSTIVRGSEQCELRTNEVSSSLKENSVSTCEAPDLFLKDIVISSFLDEVPDNSKRDTNTVAATASEDCVTKPGAVRHSTTKSSPTWKRLKPRRPLALLSCPICHQTFADWKSLEKHLYVGHSSNLAPVCWRCQGVFDNHAVLLAHECFDWGRATAEDNREDFLHPKSEAALHDCVRRLFERFYQMDKYDPTVSSERFNPSPTGPGSLIPSSSLSSDSAETGIPSVDLPEPGELTISSAMEPRLATNPSYHASCPVSGDRRADDKQLTSTVRRDRTVRAMLWRRKRKSTLRRTCYRTRDQMEAPDSINSTDETKQTTARRGFIEDINWIHTLPRVSALFQRGAKSSRVQNNRPNSTREVSTEESTADSQGPPYVCLFCNRQYLTIHSRRRHENQSHWGQYRLCCGYCDYRTNVRPAYDEHLARHFHVRRFVCPNQSSSGSSVHRELSQSQLQLSDDIPRIF
ncbi:unnamed protein product [Echinostoma caproni]|uniref:C2H2-type domain-containing protein n=1 Tax=Echinostoma caproni TaxID=27848 RepID=A0A183AWD5_9TREM|nr:unnamed protein product [Echinostoma caproni]